MFVAHNRLRAFGAALALALAAAPATAAAATKNGITPLAPKAGGTVAKGKSATFRMRVVGKGPVYVHVCKSAKKSQKDGTICFKATIGKATRHNGVVSYTQRTYDFPTYWLNVPGTYYWQAHRIDCAGGVTDCRQEGPVVKFRVR